MVKDQEFLKSKASYCLDLEKKWEQLMQVLQLVTQFQKQLILEINP